MSATAGTNKTVLITGGNRGLGKALVECFASKPDWTVVATARQASSLPQGTNIRGYSLDLSQHDDIVQFAQTLTSEQQGARRISLIIHNAGFNPKDNKSVPGYFESTFYAKDFSAANVAESMMINALHPMELTGRLMPLMTTDCVVVAISSWLGSIGNKVG
jgi:NAD(P)-dependent dehydrogenase (short-subunit alcohol dehydrogenase family)